jgi:UDPglucose 6-dehydrogenase
VLMEALWAAGATVRAYDPEAMHETARIYGTRDDLDLVGTREEALKGADALIIATEWKVFQSADFETIKSKLKSPAIFDGRNIYDPAFMKAQGFDYFAIGRGERRMARIASSF